MFKSKEIDFNGASGWEGVIKKEGKIFKKYLGVIIRKKVY